MAYITALADVIGNTMEQFASFISNITPGMMIFMSIIILGGIITYFFVRARQLIRMTGGN